MIEDPTSLLGEWTFERRVRDRFADRKLSASGTLALEQLGEGRVRWAEHGVLCWDDERVPVSRTLLVEKRGDGWVVLFEDGRDFHPWTPGATVRHDCGADTYLGHVRAEPAGGWEVTWEVAGPLKDYTMVTAFSRSSAPV